MNKVYRVTLTAEVRELLGATVRKGRAAGTLTHARILLKADQGRGGPAWTDAAIAAAVGMSPTTVHRVRRRCVEEGVTAALARRPHRASGRAGGRRRNRRRTVAYAAGGLARKGVHPIPPVACRAGARKWWLCGGIVTSTGWRRAVVVPLH